MMPGMSKYKVELELDEKRQVVIVRFHGSNGYPGIEREYSFSNDAFVIRASSGEMIKVIASWLANGEPPK